MPKVFIVDNDRTTVSLLKILFELDGYTVQIAGNPCGRRRCRRWRECVTPERHHGGEIRRRPAKFSLKAFSFNFEYVFHQGRTGEEQFRRASVVEFMIGR